MTVSSVSKWVGSVAMAFALVGCAPPAVDAGSDAELSDNGGSAALTSSDNPMGALYTHKVRCKLTGYARFNDAMDEQVAGGLETTHESDGSYTVHGPMYKFTPGEDVLPWGVAVTSTDDPQAEAVLEHEVAMVVFTRPVGTTAWTRLAPVQSIVGVAPASGGQKRAVDVYRNVSWSQGRMTSVLPFVYNPVYTNIAMDGQTEYGFFPVPAYGDLSGHRDFKIELTESDS